jgi:large repetitive protein
MKILYKFLIIFLILLLPICNVFGQSKITISPGASVSVGSSAAVTAGTRDGTMKSTGTFNTRSIVYDPVASAATSVAQSSFSANWSAAAGSAAANGYYLDVSTSSTFSSYISGYQSKDVGNVITYSVSGLTSGTTYYYRVRAYDIDGITGYYNVITVTTAPAAPTAAAASNVAQTSFSANWGSVSGATAYYLDVATDNGFTSLVTGFNNLNVGNVVTYSVTGLTGNTTYYYRVRALNTYGTSDNSNIITVITAPIAPTANNASVITQTSFTANWTASAGATGYRLDVSTSNTFSSFVTGYQDLDVTNVTSYSVSSNLSAGTTYYYRIRAYNSYGTSNSSSTITLLTIPPNPVAAAATGQTSSSFIANWAASTSATGYRLDVSTDASFGAGNFVAGYQDIDVGNVVTYTISSNITGGITYYYRVRAYNANGTSGDSGTITVITMPPSPVTTAATNLNQTSFSANWNAATGAVKYYLDVSTTSTFNTGTFVSGFQNLDVGNVTTYSVSSSLTAGTTYYYRSRALNATGLSDNSNVITLITIPPDPVATSASSINESGFTANWNASTSATGYRLDVSTDINFGAGNFVAGYQDKDVSDVTTYTITGLSAGTNYYYRVRAYNASGTSGNSGTITSLTAPAVPNPLAASGINATSFDANWVASAGASGYQIDISTSAAFGAGTFVTGYQNKDVGNNTTLLVNNYLTSGTTYYYRVRAYNASGISNSSGTINLTTVPPTPVVASATTIAATSFSANWDATSGVTGYRLDVATNSGFGAGTFVTGYQDLDVSNVVTYSVNTNLTEGTTYYYRIRAYNTAGTSGSSSVITVTTLTTTPTSTAATSVGASGFTANWNTLSGATGYSLDVATDNTFTTFVSGFNNRDVGNVTAFDVTGLSGGVTYYYRVRAYNTGGTSGNSNVQTIKTLSPAASASVASSITTTGFSANWTASTGATGYYLDVATDYAFASPVAGYIAKNVGSVITSSVSGLTAGTTYYYKITAYNASGNSAASNIISVITTPAAPSEQAATSITSSSFDANWTASTGAAGYYLDVATDAAFTGFVSGFSNKDVGNVITYTIPGLVNSTQYYYRIRAYNTGGTSTSSGTINLTTLSVTPSIPSVIPGSNNATTSFSANWNASSGATGYRLDVATDAGFGSFVTGFQDLNVNNVTTYSVTGLTAGTIYYYRVRAYNGSGTSSSSNIVLVKTIPAAPAEQAASNISTNSFDANWTASTGATGYYLDVATNSGFTLFVSGFNNRDIGNVVTYSVSGLTGNTDYYYRIRAYNTGGTSVSSGTINPKTSAGGTVIASAASVITASSFSANWDSYGGASGYILDVATTSTFTAGTFVTGFQNLDVSAVTTYSVSSGLSAGTNYYYRVTAYDGSHVSLGTSGTINVITLPDAPVAISAGSVTEISFDAKWNAATSATGYYLDVATDNGFTSFVTGFNNKYVNNVTTYSVTGLSGGVTYYYRVRAKNGSGTGASSNTITVVTIPIQPIATSATLITSSGFRANWDSELGANGYKLDVSLVANFATFVGSYNDFNAGNVTGYAISGLSSGTTYYFRIRAYNDNGTTNNSNVVTTLTLPAAPTASAASSVDKTSFSANWSASTGATKYYLDVATTSSFTAGTFVSGYQNLDVGSATTYSITGLSQGTNYYYQVRAFNTSGVSANSSTITVTTIPPEPVIASATNVLSTSFDANWNSSTGATGYRLDVSTVSNFATFVGSYSNLNVNNVTTYSLTGLTAGTTYYYRVRAYNGIGTSGNSGTMSALTSLTAPVAVSATSVNETFLLPTGIQARLPMVTSLMFLLMLGLEAF